jgi:DNA-3-methyladenine glycosylase II
MQFSTRKAEYIIDLSKAIVSGDLNLDALEDLPDEEISARLTGLRGIGRWTVDWFLARYLGRGCAFPAGDLGVRKAVEHYYFHGEKQAEENLRDFARQWGEFTNFVVHYLLLGFYSKD